MTFQLAMRQVLALIWRHWYHLRHAPISSFIRIIVEPGALLGLCGYLLVSTADDGYKGDTPFPSLVSTVIFFMTLFHVYSFSSTLVQDKASNIKSLMISMGLSRTSYYIAYMICILACTLPPVIIAAIFCADYVYVGTQASYITIIILFTLFCFQLTGFIFFITSFITSTSFIIIPAVLLSAESFIHNVAIYLLKQKTGWDALILFVLSITPFESLRLFSESYLICKNCDETQLKLGDSSDQISQPTYLILLADCFWTIALFLFSRWFDEVCPWQKDSAVQGPCFCINCTPSYQNLDEPLQDRQTSRFFERRQQNPEDGISLYHIRKCYNNVAVINDLTLKIYQGETTLLLGHNGAGKTTLMNIILGRLRPDSGYVRTRKRASLSNDVCVGYCPQTSVLDENLTVLQHIELFHDIKTPYDLNRRANINTTLDDVNLTQHAHKLPSELSGGMMRKLSLGMAFVGQSSVLILDEPSSGLDPDSRVFVWNAIRRYRSNRTVLLSTQHMEEADYLGDRIVIMNSGRIVCCGSSVFLNQLFGVGYKLRVECSGSDKTHLLSSVRRRFKQARVASGDSTESTNEHRQRDGSTVDFVIELIDDRGEDSEQKLIDLLKEFETNPSASRVKSFGLRSSSIEDVMLNTNEYFKQQIDDQHSTQVSLANMNDSIHNLTNPRRITNQVSDFERKNNHLRSLIIKIFHVYRTQWMSMIFFRVVLPSVTAYWNVSNLNIGLVNLLGNTSTPTSNLFCFAYFVYIPVMERATKFKIMQLTSNTNFVIYWLSLLITDCLTILVATIALNVLISTTFTGIMSVSAFEFHSLMSMTMILFGLASASFGYLMTLLFSESRSAFGYILLLQSASFITKALLLPLKMAIGQKINLDPLGAFLNDLFLFLIPIDAFAFTQNGFIEECYIEGSFGCRKGIPYDGLTPSVWLGAVVLLFQALFYMSILYWAEVKLIDMSYYWRQLISICRRRPKSPPRSTIDEDVAQESERASLMMQREPDSSVCLVASGLSKSYVRGIKVVEDLAFHVNRGECFGLLGVNGAGKSTTFSMLSSESKSDSGRIRAQGYYLDYDVTVYRHQVSFDPQRNPELAMRVFDALYLMARLRDIEESSIPNLITSLVRLLDMESHLWKRGSELSGGTLRKLALGMTLLGNPNLMLLDEPTAGVDPIARRGVWTLLKSLRKQNNSIVISSHAMEECEAICNRISIMARGQLRCIGSFLHLRQKFAQGCTIRVQFRDLSDEQSSRNGSNGILTQIPVMVNALKQQLESRIGPSVKLVDSNTNSATFEVADKNIKRSKLFEEMRAFKQRHAGSSYIINDSSLEDIFIKLAREQQEIDQAS